MWMIRTIIFRLQTGNWLRLFIEIIRIAFGFHEIIILILFALKWWKFLLSKWDLRNILFKIKVLFECTSIWRLINYWLQFIFLIVWKEIFSDTNVPPNFSPFLKSRRIIMLSNIQKFKDKWKVDSKGRKFLSNIIKELN